MIDFEMTKEQEMIRKVTHDFVRRELTPEVIRDHERHHRYPSEIIKKMAALGLTATTVPREYHGTGMSWVSHGLICEEIGGAWFSLCLSIQLVQTGLVEYPILKFGNEEQKQRYLPSLVKAEKIGCLAAVEPGVGSDATAVETRAILEAGYWVIDGFKTWITNGSVADVCVVLVQTDKSKGVGGLALLLVDKGTLGFSVTDIWPKTGTYCAPASQLRFNSCRVPQDNLLGEIGRGIQNAMEGINNVRYSLAAGCTGMIQSCVDACSRYTQERNQFGKAIGSFQLIQAMIADMAVDAEAARLLYLKVGYLKDKELPSRRESSIAKIFNTEAALRACIKAMRIYGAYGYSDEFPAERHYRDIMAPMIFGGTNEIHRLSIGRDIIGIDAFR
jgi:alkylation response protein AidB-like acyl-CoA dehydrogenase